MTVSASRFFEDFSLDGAAEGFPALDTTGGDLRAGLGDTLVLEDQQLRACPVADDVAGDADSWQVVVHRSIVGFLPVSARRRDVVATRQSLEHGDIDHAAGLAPPPRRSTRA